MPMEPEPAPMSQRSSPGRGARADRVSARTGRLVSWPSCWKRSSGRPEACGRPGSVASMARRRGRPMSGGGRRASGGCAPAGRRGVRGRSGGRWGGRLQQATPRVRQPPPRRAGCRSRELLSPAPDAAGQRGRRAGQGRAPPPAASPAGSRPAGRWRARGARSIRRAARWAIRLPPAPNQNGSPEARTTVGWPRWARTGVGSKGTGQGWPLSPASARARWRGPPKMDFAAASASRLAGDRPAGPSSPRPMIVSQGSSMTRILLLGGTTEANLAWRRPSPRPGLWGVYSYAGRTEAPVGQPLPVRVGGFGGVAGLVDYLRPKGSAM
jgi:hypothetical protein